MAGLDYTYTDISERAMWETYLPPFKTGVDAGVATIMTSFNDINGIPAVCNSYLIKEVLKKKWGFDGAIVSDWGAIRQLKNQGYSLDPLKCGSASLKAGNDIDMESRIYVKIPQMLKNGLISMEDIDSSKIIISDIDIMFLPIHKGDISYITSQYSSYGIDSKIIGNNNWFSPEDFNQEMIGSNLNGTVSYTHLTLPTKA